MQKTVFEIHRDRLSRYQGQRIIYFGFFVLGWLLLGFGIKKMITEWVHSLQYSLEQNCLCVSSVITLWGIVLKREEKRIPLQKITDVRLVQGPIQNMMDIEVIKIQTASTGSQFPEAIMYALKEPTRVRDAILAAISEGTPAGN